MRVSREAEFAAFDRHLLLAHLAIEADRGPHGISMAEATDPANQFAFIAPEAPSVDWAARALSEAQDRYYAANKNTKRHGHLWRVRRRGSAS